MYKLIAISLLAMSLNANAYTKEEAKSEATKTVTFLLVLDRCHASGFISQEKKLSLQLFEYLMYGYTYGEANLGQVMRIYSQVLPKVFHNMESIPDTSEAYYDCKEVQHTLEDVDASWLRVHGDEPLPTWLRSIANAILNMREF